MAFDLESYFQAVRALEKGHGASLATKVAELLSSSPIRASWRARVAERGNSYLPRRWRGVETRWAQEAQ